MRDRQWSNFAWTKSKCGQLVGDTPGNTGWVYIVYGFEEQTDELVLISADIPALERLIWQHCTELPCVGRGGGKISS